MTSVFLTFTYVHSEIIKLYQLLEWFSFRFGRLCAPLVGKDRDAERETDGERGRERQRRP